MSSSVITRRRCRRTHGTQTMVSINCNVRIDLEYNYDFNNGERMTISSGEVDTSSPLKNNKQPLLYVQSFN